MTTTSAKKASAASSSARATRAPTATTASRAMIPSFASTPDVPKIGAAKRRVRVRPEHPSSEPMCRRMLASSNDCQFHGLQVVTITV